jgi:hypothetical protein
LDNKLPSIADVIKNPDDAATLALWTFAAYLGHQTEGEPEEVRKALKEFVETGEFPLDKLAVSGKNKIFY